MRLKITGESTLASKRWTTNEKSKMNKELINSCFGEMDRLRWLGGKCDCVKPDSSVRIKAGGRDK